MSDAPRPLPPYAHAAEPGDGFDVPVYNRAGEIIGYRQSVQALRTSNIVSAPRLDIEVRPFRQPISRGAEANLRLLLMRAGRRVPRRPAGLGLGTARTGRPPFPDRRTTPHQPTVFRRAGRHGAAR